MNLPLRLAVPLASLGCTLALAASTVEVRLQERLGPLEIDRIALGQGGLAEEPMWDNRIAEIRALHPRLIRLFIQEYFNLLPEKGQFHFETLDRSVDTILATGAKPLMCIAFKPRLLFPELNQDSVEPNDYEAWQQLIFALVDHFRKRNPGITYWEVMNEPDIGEDGGCPFRFKPENYPRFYQQTAAAIHRADPDARIGGPALASAGSPLLPALLEFCERQEVPLHFVSWHIYSSDPQQIRGTIDRVKALLAKHPQLKVETFLDEWNMSLGKPPTDPRIQPCFVAEVAWQMKEAGLDYACYYHIRDYHVAATAFAPFMSPHGTTFMADWWNRMPQFDGLFDFQNTIRPAYFTFKLMSRLTGERVPLRSDTPSVHGFAAFDERDHLFNILIWNFSNTARPVTLSLAGLDKKLSAKPLVLDARTASSDENDRLRAEDYLQFTPEKPATTVELEPYGVRFWSVGW